MSSLTVPSRAVSASAGPTSTAIQINGAEPGQTLEGLGGMSVAGSSRLLFDYPPAQRSQILDYLYCSPMAQAAPGYCTHGTYGAALQRLKVEIGSDSNAGLSTGTQGTTYDVADFDDFCVQPPPASGQWPASCQDTPSG